MHEPEFQLGTIKAFECLKEGWELIKNDYWLLFAITLVGVLIGGATMYILLGAMLVGIYMCYLKVIDGEPIQFDILFKGFDRLGAGLVVVLFIVVPIIVVYVFIYIPFIAAAIMAENRVGEETILPMLVVFGVIDLVIILVMVCFHTLLIFAFPLIADRRLGGIAAMKLSARAVWRNLSGVTGLIVVNMLLSIAGQLALCIGIYFAIPIMMACNVVAYRKVFPRRDRPMFTPPPPNAYLGL